MNVRTYIPSYAEHILQYIPEDTSTPIRTYSYSDSDYGHHELHVLNDGSYVDLSVVQGSIAWAEPAFFAPVGDPDDVGM